MTVGCSDDRDSVVGASTGSISRFSPTTHALAPFDRAEYDNLTRDFEGRLPRSAGTVRAPGVARLRGRRGSPRNRLLHPV